MQGRSFLSLFLFLLALLLPIQSAHADKIRRGCAGTILLKPVTNVPLPAGRTVMARMDSSRVCNRPDNCRLDAYKAIRACVSDMWQLRWQHKLPASCQTTSRASGRSHFTFGWAQNFSGLPNGQNSMKDRIEARVCCQNPRPQESYRVQVHWNSGGDSGCGGSRSSKGTEQFISNYDINCPALRQNGLCG